MVSSLPPRRAPCSFPCKPPNDSAKDLSRTSLSCDARTFPASFPYDPATTFSKKFMFQSASFVLVLAQLWVATAISNAASAPSCARDRDCPGERMCVPNWDLYGGRGKGCYNCGDGPVRRALRPYLPADVAVDSCCPDGEKGGKLEECCRFAVEPILRPKDPDGFDCPANDLACRACFDSTSQTFSNYTFHDEVFDNVGAMQPKDWLSVCLAIF